MRKVLFASLFLFAATSVLFANNITLYGMNRDIRCNVEQNNQIVTESITANDGARYSVSAYFDNNQINYQLSVKNATNYNFLNNSNYITVYQGNFDKDSWSKISYSMDPVQPVGPTATQNTDTDEGLSTAEFCIVAGTVCLCSLALWDFCDEVLDGSSSSTHVSSSRHHHHTVWIDPIIDIEVPSNNVNRNVAPPSSNTNNNILYNRSYMSEDYTVLFHTNAGKGPDYKVSVNTGSEVLNYYFLRSDRTSTNTSSNYSYSSESDDSVYHSFVLSVPVPALDSVGINYIYSGDPVGLYIGGKFPIMAMLDTYPETVGETSNHNYSRIDTNSMYRYNRFVEGSGKSYNDYFSLNLGLNIKLTDFMWLIGGCNLDFNNRYINGDIEGSDDGSSYTLVESDCYINDFYVTCNPQLGINFIFNSVDLGLIWSYSTEKRFSVDVMLGVAF